MAIPITTYPNFYWLIPPPALDAIINNSSQRFLYSQGHSCPSVGDTGAPNPTYYSIKRCPVCLGRGIYWDPIEVDSNNNPIIHYALLTLISWLGRNVDFGAEQDPSYGLVERAHPILTIPTTDTELWSQASLYDVIVQMDTSTRQQAVLRVDVNDTIPAWHSIGNLLTVAPTGAVIVQDPSTAVPVSGIPYTVNGGQIILKPTTEYPVWPEATSFTVEYYAPNTYVIFEAYGGLPHQRPFGQGLKYPRRFKLSLLDLWLRDQLGSSTSIT